jgi:hypothetical protein
VKKITNSQWKAMTVVGWNANSPFGNEDLAELNWRRPTVRMKEHCEGIERIVTWDLKKYRRKRMREDEMSTEKLACDM